ncbi:MAG: hypothetical protein IJD04_06365 [Desulfovibrionaceae bacterium]|nr:hypothetical protein [Desulfovibrionaceae bacterium]
MGNYDEMKEEILLQLKTIVDSGNFSASARMKDFLRFLVEETLAGREYQLKAYTIGREIFKRGENFDSLTDPVVRVEAGKLRSRLDQYYASNEENGTDLIRIDIPKGSYVPVFRRLAPEKKSAPIPNIELNPDQASIAVFPFYNIGNHREIDYLLSGLAEELTMALTKFEDLTVFSAKGFNRGIGDSAGAEADLARQLGARFILSGNAQFADSTIRVRINLTDTATNKILWAEKFERSYTVENLFDIIDSTVAQVASRIGDSFGWIKRTLYKEFPEEERTEQIRAYEAVLSYHHWAANLAEDRFDLAKAALEQAIQIDPDYALAYGMLSDIYATRYQWEVEERSDLLNLSEAMANRALVLNPQSQYGLWAKGYNCYLRGEAEEFFEYARKAISINPADTYLMTVIGVKLAASGSWQEGRDMIRTACRLNPFLPDWYHTADLLYYLVNNELEKAMQEARQITSPSISGPMFRMALYGAMGQKQEAEEELKEVLKIQPSFRQGYKEFLHRMFFNEEITSCLIEGFARAGL